MTTRVCEHPAHNESPGCGNPACWKYSPDAYGKLPHMVGSMNRETWERDTLADYYDRQLTHWIAHPWQEIDGRWERRLLGNTVFCTVVQTEEGWRWQTGHPDAGRTGLGESARHARELADGALIWMLANHPKET